MNGAFINKQKIKFNRKYNFHDVFVENGWHGKKASSNPEVIPYEKYALNGGERPITLCVLPNSILITSIDSQKVNLRCETPFDCYVNLIMQGDEFTAAQEIANQIPDDDTSFKVDILIADNDDDVRASPLVLSPIENETYNDNSIHRLVPSNVFGPTQWKTIKEIRASGLISETGIPLGVLQNPNGSIEKLSYTGGKHLLTIAPSGTGKNTAVQIPVLLQYDASVFCIDPKGENALVTARYRKEIMGHDVVVINPFGIYANSFEALGIPQIGFNPLASLNPDAKDFVTQVNAVCEVLIEADEKDTFWSNSARELVACLIMYVCKTKPAEECNLIEVRRLLMQDLQKFMAGTLAFIASDDFEPMAEKAKSFLKSSKTIESVIFTAKAQLGFLHDGYLEDSLAVYGEQHIDFSTLRQTKHKNTTVYLIVPIDRISQYQKWFRMVVHTALTLFRTAHKTDTKKVLVMVDECKAIGYLPSLEDSLVYARGFGIQIWCFFQDYGQIEQIYRNPHGFFANVDVQQFFTVNDPKTAEIVSNRMGNKTYLSNSANYSPSGQITSFSQSEVRQPLMSVNQLYGLDTSHQILFYFGLSEPIRAVKVFYFKNPTLKKRADLNPYAPVKF